jgi:hypothetical protein
MMARQLFKQVIGAIGGSIVGPAAHMMGAPWPRMPLASLRIKLGCGPVNA